MNKCLTLFEKMLKEAKKLTLFTSVRFSSVKSISINQAPGFPIAKVSFWITFNYLFVARLFETTL